MNKKFFLGTFVVFTLVLTAFVAVPSAEAKQDGKGHGNSNFPGNSLYGRLHNPHFAYKWGNQSFSEFEDYIAYMQQWINAWRSQNKHRNCDCDNTSNTDIQVVTRSATSIDTDDATLRGKVHLDEDETATVWFEYGTSATNLNSDTNELTIEHEDDPNFSIEVDDLSADTRYYFRAVAEDEDGEKEYGYVLYFTTLDTDDSDEETPNVVTRSPADITDETAIVRGRVEMEDFDNGIVFFVYGTDENKILDVDDDFDTFEEITETSSLLKKVEVEDDLDGNASYEYEVKNLSTDTQYHYRIGVQYEDENGDDTLELGDLRSFRTEK
jgi:hypothetical protein